MKAGAPVDCTSAPAEVTAFGAGRLNDEESFVGSAALGCIKVPAEVGKMEISVYTVDGGVQDGLVLVEDLNAMMCINTAWHENDQELA